MMCATWIGDRTLVQSIISKSVTDMNFGAVQDNED